MGKKWNHSEASRKKISEASSKNQLGSKNHMYGKCYIHNNIESKLILKEELEKYLTNGWIKGRIRTWPKYEFSAEDKMRLSLIMKEKYKNGWECKCGRAPKIDYESPIAGKIKVDGSWELKVVQFLDSLPLTWERNKKRFSYINLKGKESTYCPDFWIEEWNSYLEVKGYQTELDNCKWSQFKYPLIIWKKEDLKKLNLL